MKAPLGSLPLHMQVTEFLVRELAAGRLVEGEKLAPEREMADALGIAVGTLRKALAELQARGHLERIQGSGNYIRAGSPQNSIYSMFRLELASGGGGLPTARVLELKRLRKPRHLPPFGSADHAHRIRRLRAISGRPAALEEIWLDGSCAERLSKGDLLESLYLFYRTRLNLFIETAEDRIGLGEVPDWAPKDFALRPGSPVPHVMRLSRAADRSIPEVSQTWFDPAVAVYVSRLR
ncbi:GntR family transcriptional regulator [Bradyrhizobium sp. HKCCYLS20291]|uniref:GntR family transcriptional regulator n=1 Tax=Bradyrhizobium sp. HKCCYLS20291 TaxID=3420766 RepID=UPI003EBA0AD1